MSVDAQVNNYLNMLSQVSPEHEKVIAEHIEQIRTILARYPETERLQAVNGIGAVLDRTALRANGIASSQTTITELELGAYAGARKPSKKEFILDTIGNHVITPGNLRSLLNGHRIPEYLVQQENHSMMLPKRAAIRGAYFC